MAATPSDPLNQSLPAVQQSPVAGVKPETPLPYAVIGECLRAKDVIPFLGAGASCAGPAAQTFRLPSGGQLATRLSQLGPYPGPSSDPLSKIAQYLEEGPADRPFLLKHIAALFSDGVPDSYESFSTHLLRIIPRTMIPHLIVTTNYDLLVERTLQERSIPYISICHITRGNRFAGRFLRYADLAEPLTRDSIMTRKQLDEQLIDLAHATDPTTVVYKMHGTARIEGNAGMIDSIVLTENDYVDFLAQEWLAKIPGTILNCLRKSRLLFLGYSLSDWNFRVLLRRIQLLQQQGGDSPTRHWAVLEHADEVEEKFWSTRSVSLYRKDLMAMLKDLGPILTKGAQQ